MINKNKLPLIVIFGRTNVGKSTLFNCLTEKHKAIISKIEGTTRDSNIGNMQWNGYDLRLVDTGGIIDPENLIKSKKQEKADKKKQTTEIDDINIKVQKQARDYLKRADLILFLVDVRTGLLPADKQMALHLKKILPTSNNIILTANKADGPRLRKETAEFNKLSLGEPIPVSASTGSGTGDLLDIIVDKLKTHFKPPLNDAAIQSIQNSKFSAKSGFAPDGKIQNSINVAILGKPNVGKSSIVNAIIGEQRIIVSPIPHTTREPQDTKIKYKEHVINLIDTAGISKKGQKQAKHAKNKNTLEKFSITKSLAVLKKADIALLMLDINKEITRQDAKLVEEIVSRKVSLIIVANKWDLIEERNTKSYTMFIYKHLPFVTWAPIQFTSALTGSKVDKILDLILHIDEQRKIQIQPSPLNKFLGKIVKKHLPAKAKGTKHPRIYELKQIKTNPPKFSIRIGVKDTIHFSYIRFIENRLREKFGFTGTPITIKIEKGRNIEHETLNMKH